MCHRYVYTSIFGLTYFDVQSTAHGQEKKWAIFDETDSNEGKHGKLKPRTSSLRTFGTTV